MIVLRAWDPLLWCWIIFKTAAQKWDQLFTATSNLPSLIFFLLTFRVLFLSDDRSRLLSRLFKSLILATKAKISQSLSLSAVEWSIVAYTIVARPRRSICWVLIFITFFLCLHFINFVSFFYSHFLWFPIFPRIVVRNMRPNITVY